MSDPAGEGWSMSVTRDGDATALAPTGDLDIAAAATLEQARHADVAHGSG